MNLSYRNILKSFVDPCVLKWYFRNKLKIEFSDQPAFLPKTSWNSSAGYSNLE